MRRCGLVGVGLVLGAFLGALAAQLAGESYQADVVLLTAPSDPRGEVEDEYGLAFARLATRSDVVGPRLREAGFEDLAEDPEQAISTQSSVESPSFDITATGDTADEAAAIANAAAEGLETFTGDRAPQTGYRAVVIGPASAPVEQAGLSASLAALAGGAFGLSLALLIILARRSR